MVIAHGYSPWLYLILITPSASALFPSAFVGTYDLDSFGGDKKWFSHVIERNRPPKNSVAFEPGDLEVDFVCFFQCFGGDNVFKGEHLYLKIGQKVP